MSVLAKVMFTERGKVLGGSLVFFFFLNVFLCYSFIIKLGYLNNPGR